MIYGNYLRDKYNNTAVKIADAEGVPCVMEYSKGKNLRNYEIYGNSVQDSTPTPDTPIEIQSVGDLVTDETSEYYGKYDVPVTVRGKNLINENSITVASGYWSDSTGSPLNSSNHIRISPVKCKPNTRYTLSSNLKIYTIWFFNNDTCISKTYRNNAVATIKTPENCNSLRISLYNTSGNADTVAFKWIQLELGATATAYEPYAGETKHIYLNEPLRKAGDYADYIDFKNKKVVRNVGETTFNGSETWVKTGDVLAGVYQGFAVSNSVYNIPKGTNLICLSDKFPYASGKAANIVTIGNSAYGLRIIIGAEYVPDLDVTTFKTWLSANNVKIIYPIATPTKESISLPALKTFKGTSIMSVDTTIQPSNIKTKYVRL